MSAPLNWSSLKFSFTLMVRIGTLLRYSNSVLWARRESQWCNKQDVVSIFKLSFQTTELCFKRNSSFDCTGPQSYTGSTFILMKSMKMHSDSRHCLVLQPALVLKMKFLQILQRDVLLFFSASQAQSLQAILYTHEKLRNSLIWNITKKIPTLWWTELETGEGTSGEALR